MQIDDKDYSRLKSSFQTAMDTYQNLLLIEERYRVEKEYLAQSEIEAQGVDAAGPQTSVEVPLEDKKKDSADEG